MGEVLRIPQLIFDQTQGIRFVTNWYWYVTVSPRKRISVKRHPEKLHPRHIFWSNHVDVRTLSWCWCNDFPSLCEPELVTPNKLGLKLSTHSTRGRGNFETRRSSLCLLREEVISTRKNPNIPNSTIPGFIDNWKSNSNSISNWNFQLILIFYQFTPLLFLAPMIM